MTQPIPPGTPTTQGDAAKPDSYFVRDPVTGGVREVGLEDAQILIHKNDWLPADEKTASTISNLHAKSEAAEAAPDLGKLGYGIARGAGTPLVDLAYPAGARVHESLSEDSPWLVGGGEALGMIGSAVAGAGPVALLEEGAAKATAGVAAGNTALRLAARRGAQAGIEGGAYGAMGAVSEAHDTNTPLTAQRFASEVVPGMLFGGVLGAGFGGLEGLAGRSLTSRLAKIDESKLDAIFKSGVDDVDALRIGKEFGGVKDPSLGHQLQSLASGGDVSPELIAMANDAGPVGQRLRKELAFGHEELAQAERKVVDLGGDFLVAREEAMKQIQSNLKRGHIADLVGPGEAGPADIEMLVRRHVAEAAPEAERAAFVDRALGHIDDTSREQLERSLGTSGNLRERLIAGLVGGQNETLEALKAVMAKSKLTDDALREFGEQGVWASKPLDVINKWKPQIEMLMSAPRGVHDAAGDFKKLIGNLEHHEQGILGGNRANAAAELDDLKKRLAAFAKPGERLAAGDGVAITARGMYEDLRTVLEDPTIWGARFADKQRKINEVLHRSMGVGNEFDNAFVQQIGTPDPDNPWVNAKVFDSGKVNKALREMSEPKSLEQLTRLREYLDDQKKFFKEVLGFKLGGQTQVRIQGALKQIDNLRGAVDKGVYLNGRARQAKALLGFSANGGKAILSAGLGAVMGGAPGAVAGGVISAALNPGKMLQMRAIAERMAESTNSRVWRGISKLLGLRVGDAARGAAGFIGRAAGKAAPHAGKAGSVVSIMLRERGDERAETYNETVKQIMEARARLPELDSKLDDTMPMLEHALPGTKAQMLAQAQRGLDYVIDHMPVQPRMRLYGARAAPLSDYDYENFIRMTMAATDPTSILEMAADGELTPNAVAAAEYSAPEFVAYVRGEMVRAISDHGPDSISYDKRISASLVMGTPLDESLEPENIAIQQATHQKRRELAAEAKEKRGSDGGGGETGVNDRYSSKSDQIEAGAPPR